MPDKYKQFAPNAIAKNPFLETHMIARAVAESVGSQDAPSAGEAFIAYAAMRQAIVSQPELAKNRYFTAAVEAAYGRFMAVWQAMP